MRLLSPGKNMQCLEKVLDAWRDIAPGEKFGGLNLAEFEALVDASRQSRVTLVDKQNEVISAIVGRENNDIAALTSKAIVVNGVIGNPDFGPDSALYEAMGYVRKSSRKSGLTRKKKVPSI